MNESFDITGTWINRINGDKLTVRNTFIDGDNMIITTTDGRQITMNEFQNYIQMSDDEYDSNGHMIGKSKITENIENFRNIENERRVVVGNTPLGNNSYNNNSSQIQRNVIDNTIEPTPKKKETIENRIEETESEKLLKKLFEKIELDININVDLNCSNFPVSELKMLQTFYDVNIDEISEYMINNIINYNIFRSAVSSYIKDQLK